MLLILIFRMVVFFVLLTMILFLPTRWWIGVVSGVLVSEGGSSVH